MPTFPAGGVRGGGKCLFLAWFSRRLAADWPFPSKVPWAVTERGAQPSAKIDLNITQNQGRKSFNSSPRKAKLFAKCSSNITVNADISRGKHVESPEVGQLLSWEPLAKSDLST